MLMHRTDGTFLKFHFHHHQLPVIPHYLASEENKQQTKRVNEIMKEYRKEYFAEGQLFYFLKAHDYSTYYGCGVEAMTDAHYQVTLPDNEYIFGNNSK